MNPVAPGGMVTFTIVVDTLAPGQVTPGGTIAILIDGKDVSGPIPLFEDGPTSGAIEVTFKAPTSPSTDTVVAVYHGDNDTNPSASPPLLQEVAGPVGAAAPSPPPASSGSSAQPSTTATPAATVPGLDAMTAPLVRSLKRRGLAAVAGVAESFRAPAPGVLSQRIYSPAAPVGALAARVRPVLLASARHVFAGAAKGTLRLRLTAAGRRAARRFASLRLEIVTRFAPSTGTPIVTVRRLTIKRRSAAAHLTSTSPRATWDLVAEASHADRGANCSALDSACAWILRSFARGS